MKALLPLLLCVSCGAVETVAPDGMYVEYHMMDTDFDGSWANNQGFTSSGRGLTFGFSWDLHRQAAPEIRGLRNDQRNRHEEATVEEEEEKEQAEIVADAEQKAEEKAKDGQFDWLFNNIEIWFIVLTASLGIVWRLGRWVQKIKDKAEADGKSGI